MDKKKKKGKVVIGEDLEMELILYLAKNTTVKQRLDWLDKSLKIRKGLPI